MNSYEAFVTFVNRTLIPARAGRFATLATSKKGQTKILSGLNHDFERAIRPGVGGPVGRASAGKQTCYAFHASVGFGEAFDSVQKAYDRLSADDGRLIIVADASAGIYRPESRWDAEVLIMGPRGKSDS